MSWKNSSSNNEEGNWRAGRWHSKPEWDRQVRKTEWEQGEQRRQFREE